MIIGNGQLAQAFSKNERNNTLIFASGVSNSNCTDEVKFDRERQLLLSTLQSYGDKKFVYFSSCALSAPEYPKNVYYQHKQQMEDLIKTHSNHYFIFRIPQLFGKLKHHNTLINFLYESILKGTSFNVYSKAYRYLIEINDVVKLVEAYLNFSESNVTIDLANPHRYSVLDIIECFETLLHKKANYEILEKEDGYILNLDALLHFIDEYKVPVHFSEDYFVKKLNSIL
ncbi:MAG: NAD-dependent epimerase/dehydratase family protein [Sulfuricurvum sp.]